MPTKQKLIFHCFFCRFVDACSLSGLLSAPVTKVTLKYLWFTIEIRKLIKLIKALEISRLKFHVFLGVLYLTTGKTSETPWRYWRQHSWCKRECKINICITIRIQV